VTLPPPEVVGCYFDIGFMPPIAAMLLRWADEAARDWALPVGEAVHGPLPRRFGVRVRRQDEDAYSVALVWDSTYRQWFSLRRREIVGTAVEPVLAALGTQLAYLLDQPIGAAERQVPDAA
jgi:hypothetical protein